MEYITRKELYLAYIGCIKRKRSSKWFLLYYENWIENNELLYLDLNNLTYSIGVNKAFIVTRPKLREVFCALFRDRIVHHLIYNKFNKIFEALMIDNSFSCRKGKGTLHGIKTAANIIKDISNNYTKETWILKCDLKGFFMSIDRLLLYSIIEQYIKTNYFESDLKWWLWLLNIVILNKPELNCIKVGDLTLWNKLPKEKSLFNTNGIGLPIGNLTSLVFANLFLSSIDKYILSFGVGYVRYVDDMLFILNDKNKLLSLIDIVKHKLKLIGVTLHPKKIYIQESHKGVLFIGGYIMPNRIYTSNRCINNMIMCIHNWNNIENPTQNQLDNFLYKINSYFGFLKHTNSYGIKCKMWNMINHKNLIWCKNMIYIKQIKHN